MSVATPKQLFALFCGTGLNTRGCTISLEQASSLISNMKNGIDIVDDLRRFGAVGEAKKKKEDFQKIYDAAHKAGMEAVEKCNPTPMIVTQRANPLDDSSEIEKAYYVPSGPCGFAEVIIKPANSSFANWLKDNKLASKRYNGGVSVWIGSQLGKLSGTQSIQIKESYAYAFAKSLRENGFKNVYVDSRLD